VSSKKIVAVPSVAQSVLALDEQVSLNIPQLAKYTGLTPWQARMAIWSGKLPAKKHGRNLIVLRSDADAYISSLPNVAPATDKAWFAKRQAVRP